MAIELPTIEPRLKIGSINPHTGEISVSDNPVFFSCQLSTDCCGNNEFFVPVTDMDIERIEDHGYEIDQIVEKISPEIRFARDNTAEKNYWIKRKPFTGECRFLEGKHCSIHEFKPFACRIFPFQLVGTDSPAYDVVVHSSNLCQSVKGATPEKSNNRDLLEDLLKEVQLEDKRRIAYFEKYGNS